MDAMDKEINPPGQTKVLIVDDEHYTRNFIRALLFTDRLYQNP